MILAGKRKVERAAVQSGIVYNDLEELKDAIMDSVGKARDLDDNDSIAQCFTIVNESSERMLSVYESLTEIINRQGNRNSTQKRENTTDKKENENPFTLITERNIRKTVEKSSKAYEELKALFSMCLYSIGSMDSIDDKERLYQTLKTIESSRDSLQQVSNTLNDINQRIEQIELEALYAPPSYFGGE